MATVSERIEEYAASLTRAELQLADIIAQNYPASGLGSITELAERAGVSTPTVARMVQKLGFDGYGAFQFALREELEAIVSNPIAKHNRWARDLPEGHVLNRYAQATTDNLRRTVEQVSPEDFDAFCTALADPVRRVHVGGGRLSGALAQYFFLHLQMIRPGVAQIGGASNAWPHQVLDLGATDLVVLFDVRRYENTTMQLAEMAHARGAEIVLFTDQWRSPIGRLASRVFAARIAVPSAWDSGMGLMFLIEAAIAALQQGRWDEVRARTDALEQIFDQTRLFRKFT